MISIVTGPLISDGVCLMTCECECLIFFLICTRPNYYYVSLAFFVHGICTHVDRHYLWCEGRGKKKKGQE